MIKGNKKENRLVDKLGAVKTGLEVFGIEKRIKDLENKSQLLQGRSGGGGSKNVNADWNAVAGDALILNKPTLAQDEKGATNKFLTAFDSATGAFSKARPVQADIDGLTTSDSPDLRNLYLGPTLEANADIVESGCYLASESGDANWFSGVYTHLSVLNNNHATRVYQTGTVTKVGFNIQAKPDAVTGFYIEFWRYDGSRWDKIGSEDVWSQVSIGDNLIELTTPVDVIEGDYTGVKITATKDAKAFFIYAPESVANSSLYTTTAPDETDYNWAAQSTSTKYFPIKCYGQAPQLVAIGDSIISGIPGHYAFTSTTNTTDIDTHISYFVSQYLGGLSFQNMGIGSQSTTDVKNRFTTDVVDKKPRFVIIEGGGNNIVNSGTLQTFLDDYNTMLTACEANDIIPIILLIPPRNGFTTTQSRTKDTWNTALTTLAGNFSTAIVVEPNTYIGEFRAGGDEGNLWDIQDIYNADNTHFTTAGHAQIARAIADALGGNLEFSTKITGNEIELSGQLTSTVADGTAPIVVASKTMVDNLNADLLDGHDGSYYAVAGNTVAVANGGTGLTSAATGSILAANSADTLSAITSASGLRVLKNNAGTISWNTVSGTGDSVMATSPTLVTPILGVAEFTSLTAGTDAQIARDKANSLYMPAGDQFYADNLLKQAETQIIESISSIVTPANIRGLWVFDPVSGTVLNDRGFSAAAHTGTLSADASTLSPTVDGLARNLTFSATAQWSTADAADLSFGNSSTDSAFSIVVAVNPTDVTSGTLLGKHDVTTGNTQMEWQLQTSAGDKIIMYLFDDSTGGYIGRSYNSTITTDEGSWHIYAGTYSGSSAASGIKIYRDGTRIDDTTISSGSYTAMEDKSAVVGCYITNAAGNIANRFKGRAAVKLLVAEELTAEQIKRLTTILQGYVGSFV